MKFSKETSALFSNVEGILNPCMTFNLNSLVDQTTKIYVYKFDVSCLVEVIYTKDSIKMIEFPFTKEGASNSIERDIEFMVSYFNSANLLDKRFLFNVDFKIPVTHDDFELKSNLDLSTKQDIAFTTSNDKTGYITGVGEVNMFLTTENLYLIDNAIFSIIRDSRFICGITNHKNMIGMLATTVISGMLSGIKSEELSKQLEIVDLNIKFNHSIGGIKFGSFFMNKMASGIKTKKFFTSLYMNLESPEQEFSGEVVNISTIINMGLDQFVKTIKDPKKKVLVNADIKIPGFKLMFIKDGAAFASVENNAVYYGIKDLLKSDQVYLLMS